MKEELLTTVEAFIRRHQLLDKEKKYLVALSGGADSVGLLLILLRLGYQVEAVHCNFMLRGEESQSDEDFVENLCRQKNVILHKVHFDTRTYAQLHRLSIEMAARQLRYNYFEQLRTDLQTSDICVAHHRDDSVETILLNLLRSTGLHGLTGIRPRNGHVVRPLLCIGHADIVQWLHGQQQPFVTDSTNLMPIARRNSLRLNVIPALNAAVPSATEGILASSRRLAQAALVYDAAVRQALARLVHDDAISLTDLLGEPSPESILFEWLCPEGFTPATIESIATRMTKAEGGTHWQSATHRLTLHQKHLVLRPLLPPLPSLRLPEPGYYAYEGRHLRLSTVSEAHVSRQPNLASLDADKIRFPLTIRPVTQGDRFRPFGMEGTSLVSDFLSDRHTMPIDRERQLVVTDAQGHIVWLVGLRTDGRFAVTADTCHTLFISYEEN